MVGGGKGLSVGRCTALRSIRIDAEEIFPVITRVHIRAYCTWFAPDFSSPRYLPRLALSSEKSSSMFHVVVAARLVSSRGKASTKMVRECLIMDACSCQRRLRFGMCSNA